MLDSRIAPAWDAVALAVADWAGARGVSLADAVLLLPFAQLLAPARNAFARRGGFLPRIETTRTLAATLGPVPAPEAGTLSFDAAIDRLTGAREMARQPFGRDWQRRDRPGFEAAVARMVETAHALQRRATELPPAERDAFWQRGRDALAPRSGPGAAEQQLARIALEWAALSGAPATDRLFTHRPSGWIALRAGGPDALAEALLGSAPADIPALLIDADAGAAPRQPVLALCADLEDEAQCAAAQVLASLREGQAPVALVALDRGVVRRVHALLARQGVAVRDETGWKLSTTRAAALVMAALQVLQAQASTDVLVDWLKACGPWPGVPRGADALGALEAHCRGRALRRVADLAGTPPTDAAAALWQAVVAALAAFEPAVRRPLGERLSDLARLLDAAGAMTRLRDDEAGRQVLAALRLDDPEAPPTGRLGDAAAAAMNGDELRRWIDTLLEDRSFEPSAGPIETAQVVIVPMARAMLRPFGAVVCPGADAARLGAWPAPHALLSERQLAALGLPDAAQRRAQERLAFAQLAALPNLTLLRRREDEGQPLVDSPWVEQLRLALGPLPAWVDPRERRAITAQPVRASAPSAGHRLPRSLSASMVEALRACPYRFFALHLLRLKEVPELDAEVEKRDYGTWLHAVLRRFHGARAPGADDAVALQAAAEAVQAEQRLPDDEFLPYAASFAHFVPRYVEWLHARDADGIAWERGERDAEVLPPPLGGTGLHGRIDRVDARGDARELIDYKTGSVQGLKDRVAEPFEDTQLAFYAALLAPEGRPLAALYLQLDDAHSPVPIEHAQVERSATALVEGLGDELARLRAGAPLRPLGEADTCTHCAARGLCRRDHWAEPEHR